MVAKLIAIDGTEQELSAEEYVEIKIKLIDKLPTQQEQLLALIKLIQEMKASGDEEWAEPTEFIPEHPEIS